MRSSRSWSPWKRTSRVHRASYEPVTATSGPTTVRRARDGGLCVFDFDNAGLADPSQELALILVEYCTADPRRAGVIRAAYAEAGGPGRVEDPTDFAMSIAQLSHILAEGCRRWLTATTDAERGDNEGWVREFVDRPLTRTVIEALLAD